MWKPCAASIVCISQQIGYWTQKKKTFGFSLCLERTERTETQWIGYRLPLFVTSRRRDVTSALTVAIRRTRNSRHDGNRVEDYRKTIKNESGELQS